MRLFIIPFNSYSLSTQINLILELMSCKVSRVQLIQQAAELFQWISGHGHEFLVWRYSKNCMHYREGNDSVFALDAHGLGPLNVDVTCGAEVLTIYFTKSNCEYSSARTARSALSYILPAVNGFTFGEHTLITMLLRWMLKYSPTFLRYTFTCLWCQICSRLYQRMFYFSKTFEFQKILAVSCLLSRQRSQTLISLSTDST